MSLDVKRHFREFKWIEKYKIWGWEWAQQGAKADTYTST